MSGLPEQVEAAVREATEGWPPDGVPYVRQIAYEMVESDLPHDTIAEWIRDLIRHASSARDLQWLGEGATRDILKKQLFPKIHGKPKPHDHTFMEARPGEMCVAENDCMLTWEEYERRERR